MSDEGGTYRPLRAPQSPAVEKPASLPVSGKRLALVTGGHRRLGGIIAATLAKAGFTLAIHGSHDTLLDGGMAQLFEENNTAWQGFVADFSNLEAADELVANVADAFGRPPDLLVNSAAIFGQDRLENVTPDALMRHYAVNCAAPTLLSKAFAMVPAGPIDRCIVNILDQRIAQPHGDQLSYSLSKMALAGLTQITARELAPQVRVNAVAPGLTIATPDYSEEQMKDLAEAMPLHRLPLAEQIADAVLYLSGATAMTGQVLYVDGGAHMRSYGRDFMHL